MTPALQSAPRPLSDLQAVEVVLVSPRNPLNIGAVARAMANFGFRQLTLVNPYEPHWREAQSAVGAEDLLQSANVCATLAEALASATLVFGTGTLDYRKPEQPVVELPALAPIVREELARSGRVALVFGPEKHGLTRQDLSFCHRLLTVPTDARQPSMNLGQAVAVCLYELASRLRQCEDQAEPPVESRPESPSESQTGPPVETPARSKRPPLPELAATSSNLGLLAGAIEETMLAAGYSPRSMQAANRHDLRLLLRRLGPHAKDTRRILGLFRRILWRLAHPPVD